MLFSVDTKVRGRFFEKRCGPPRRCARNASAALENFVCCLQKTFSTASVKVRRTQPEQMSSGLPLKADIALYSRHVSKAPCVDGSGFAREIFTSQAWSVQPCVRPVGAVH